MAQDLPRRSLLWLPAVALGSGCTAPVRRQQDLISQLDREIIALGQENARLREQLRTCDTGGEPPPIYLELRQVFGGMEIGVSHEGQDVRVRLPGGLLFSPGATELRTESEFAMDLLSTALNIHADLRITVTAHTDDQPPSGRLKRRFPTNWELSLARAAAVGRDLIEGWGLSPHRFTFAGRAEWDPIADNDTPEGREANRRVDVLIQPPEDP